MMRAVAEGMRRGADAMVRSLGGAEVVLCIPAPPAVGDAGEQLGLRIPEFQGKTLAPVAVRRRSDEVQVLVAAAVLETVLNVEGDGAVGEWMRAVSAVQMGDETFALTGVESADFMGHACLYRLLLQTRVAEGY